ncbi:MAG: Glycerol-3-phosphate dehydrogenase (NAD(P)+) [Synergistetes bacterium ADurb.Bin155]|jgi:glycerol-3-phosphate dehydrogenase (NAD(P)+)|nr:NAD(P)-dependent glycerol-3-phosphate dehydrogenase [Synergistaceae bacterium]OQB45805.1 MAG: Glycerol-3-phosphate dehydrogenase (NAD(P)+) [Synergistetes bacterium ADurb.Bin155]
MGKITVYGAGSWGTAAADLLARGGHQATLWCRRPEQARAINATGRNPDYLKRTDLSPALLVTADLEEAAVSSQFHVIAVPTQSVREFLSGAARYWPRDVRVCNLAKGIEIASGDRISQVVAETLPGSRYSVLSGPSHAEEVADGKPAAVVAASSIPGEAELWQGIFSGKLFRVYTSDDVVGVEIGGAVKNVIAIAAGIAASREMGHNALAALVCRGLAEVMRLGAKLGAHPLTLAGLAGVGDLMVTCFSGLSRNYRLGLAVGGGMTLTQALNSLGQVAEGAYTVDALVRNAREIDIELPLTEAVHRILYDAVSPESMVGSLFGRELKPELPPEMYWGRGTSRGD